MEGMKSLVLFCPLVLFSKVYISNATGGGRFGDNLLTYMHAKAFAHHYELQFLLKDFIYSDKLLLSKTEKRVQPMRVITLNKNNFNEMSEAIKSGKFKDDQMDVIIEIPYFPEALAEHKTWDYIYFEVPWKDEKLKAILREKVAPVDNNLSLVQIPKNKISVAVHVRTGGSWQPDNADTRASFPLKFPPLSFYVSGLQKVFDVLGAKQPYYIYVFTDDDNPQKIVNYFKEHFPWENIIFDCRAHGNRHDRNIIDDFFSLTKFDCAVHAMSNYSVTASKLADYIIEVEPVEVEQKNGLSCVTQMNVNIAPSYENTLSR